MGPRVPPGLQLLSALFPNRSSASSCRDNITVQPFRGCLKKLNLNNGYQLPAEQVGISRGCPDSSLVGPPLPALTSGLQHAGCFKEGTFVPLRSSAKQSSTSGALCRPPSQTSAWMVTWPCPWGSRACRTRGSSCSTSSRLGPTLLPKWCSLGG